jgi:glycine cleavage system H protein
MTIPSDRSYTKDHEWILVLPEGVAVVGITSFAQSELGEVVYIELPKEGETIEKGGSFCVVESTKAASDVYAPVSGKVVEVNTALQKEPSIINHDPYDKGWLVKLTNIKTEHLTGLMDSVGYKSLIE